MCGAVLYGQFRSEKLADENLIAHKIVHEINNFGVSERQKLMVIYFLSLELEDIEVMRLLTSLLREKKGNEMFIATDEEQNGT